MMQRRDCFHTEGFTARRIFSQGVTYTYDDVIFHPGYIDFGADTVRILEVIGADTVRILEVI